MLSAFYIPNGPIGERNLVALSNLQICEVLPDRQKMQIWHFPEVSDEWFFYIYIYMTCLILLMDEILHHLLKAVDFKD